MTDVRATATTRALRPRRPRRGPVLLAIGAVLIAIVVLDSSSVRSSSGVTTTGGAAAIASEPNVPATDAVSTTWFCAEGTSTPDGRATETVVVASIADVPVDATITVMTGDHAPVTRGVRLEPREQREIPVSDIVAAAEPGVVVEVVGGQAVVSHELRGQGDLAVEPCARSANPDWYFANGTTVRGSQQYLVVFNPFGDDAVVDVSFLTDSGEQEPDTTQGVVIPRRSRVSIPVHEAIERQTLVAAHVQARAGRVVVERTQLFDGSSSQGVPLRKGIAVSLGATAPSLNWEFGAVTNVSGAAQTVAVANFGNFSTSAEVAVRLVDQQTVVPKRVTVAAGAVEIVDVGALAPAGAVYTVSVTARDAEGHEPPVVAETSASWPPDVGGRSVATMIGGTRTSRRWVVALPALGSGTTASVTVTNAGTDPVTAALAVMRAGDTRPLTSQPELAVPAAEIAAFDVTTFSGHALVVTSNRPVTVTLTIVGAAGGSASPAIPDYSAAG
jgi:hypothetical protein